MCRGYLSPEYATYGEVSTKLDVFSFGVLALEIVSKRKNIEPSLPSEQLCLTLWVCNFGPYLNFMSNFFVMQICIMSHANIRSNGLSKSLGLDPMTIIP